MTLDQNTLSKIRNYGALKDTEKEAFLQEYSDPQSQVRRYYDQGVAIGEYNADVELAKLGEKGDVLAIVELSRIQHKRRIDQTRHDLFGI